MYQILDTYGGIDYNTSCVSCIHAAYDFTAARILFIDEVLPCFRHISPKNASGKRFTVSVPGCRRRRGAPYSAAGGVREEKLFQHRPDTAFVFLAAMLFLQQGGSRRQEAGRFT